MAGQYGTFDEVRDRLEQIVEEVGAEGITLDEALALYEEAVKLGLSACDLSEQDALEAYEAEQAAAESHADPSSVEADASGEQASASEQASAASDEQAAGSR